MYEPVLDHTPNQPITGHELLVHLRNRPPICLVMIVRDEADVIVRCLKSVRDYIDAYCIVDTGSEDATRVLAASTLRDVFGRIYNRPWVDFATNRTEALQLARETCAAIYDRGAWLLTVDADEEIVFPNGWAWDGLKADAYELEVRVEGSDLTFTRHLLLRASAPWRYEGAVHEDIARDGETPATGFRGGKLPGPYVLTRRDGARQKNPRKYLDDAGTIKRSMSRQAFYLAQSLRDHWIMTRDASALEEALVRYTDRAGMPGWDQETWRATFEVARCKELLEHPPREVIESYLAAFATRPSRAESLAALAAYLRRIGQSEVARVFDAYTARMAPPAGDSMYVEHSAYGGPDVRIGVITAPRPDATLNMTLTSAIASDALVTPASMMVFSDSVAPPACSIPVRCESEAELQRRLELRGIYGTLNLARALEWASEAKDVAVTLEDDVMCSRDWLARGIALLEAAERVLGVAWVISLHDMHSLTALGKEVVRVGADRGLDKSDKTFANGSQGYLMRPATARALASELQSAMSLPTAEERKSFAMDLGMMRLTAGESPRMLLADPCLLVHIDSAPSTWATGPEGLTHEDGTSWTEDEHRAARITRRFRPW